MASSSWRIWAAAAAGLLAAPALHAQAAAPPAEAARAADLDVIARAFIPAGSVAAMIEQGFEVVLRGRMNQAADWLDMERRRPGLIDARVAAGKAAGLAGVPAVEAQLLGEARDYFAAKLTAREQAGFAAYLRKPFPQRKARMNIVIRPGETVTQATDRTMRETDASASAEERRQEAAFYATPPGRKCQALILAFQTESADRFGALAGELTRQAIAKGDEAAARHIEAGPTL